MTRVAVNYMSLMKPSGVDKMMDEKQLKRVARAIGYGYVIYTLVGIANSVRGTPINLDNTILLLLMLFFCIGMGYLISWGEER